MKVTALSITAPESAQENPQVTPELLASCLAKYSRSNEGLENILNRIDYNNLDKSVDNIFKFIDYGHASIGGLTGGIPICVDGASMFLIYKIFEIAQLCDGQESSTRYINFKEATYDPSDYGIPDDMSDDWVNFMNKSIRIYQEVYSDLDDKIKKNPGLLKLPNDLEPKVVDRLRKNYALDRSRYLIPFATKTNGAFIMTARNWADTICQLGSIPLVEAFECATKLRDELIKYVPRLIKHTQATEASIYQAESRISYALKKLSTPDIIDEEHQNYIDSLTKEAKGRIYASILGTDDFPSFIPFTQEWSDTFAEKLNRYSIVGDNAKRMTVRAAWNNMTVAELRDLNRHRSGFRFSPLVPTGFHLEKEIEHPEIPNLLHDYQNILRRLANHKDPDVRACYVYGFLLGTQVAFEHTTQLDKFIYEIELRTGLGSHFRYAKHLRDAYEMLMVQMPELKPYVQLGSSEPDIN